MYRVPSDLSGNAVIGVLCVTKDRHPLHLHVMIASQLPETRVVEDMVRIKTEVLPNARCYLCTIEKENFAGPIEGRMRTLKENMRILAEFDDHHNDDEMTKHLVIFVLPILYSLPLVVIPMYVDTHAVLRFETLHFFSLRMS